MTTTIALHTYYWIGALNFLLLLLVYPDFRLGAWFSNWTRSHDGHVLGYVFKAYAIIVLIIGCILLYLAWDMVAYVNPKINLIFIIFMCCIPYLIGREILTGKKLF